MLFLLVSCNSYNKLLKSSDYDYKYEAAKEYYTSGKYERAIVLLDELIVILKGTDKAEESLYMLGMSYYGQGDYETASHYFISYYNNYPRGIYTEEARFYTGKTLYMAVPEPRLDQSSTIKAIQELQMFLEYYPESERKELVHEMLYELQNNLAEKEYESAKLYFNLGPYMGNFSQNSGNNYEACVITAQNAIKDYPYCKQREDLAFLILRAKYEMAIQSVTEKKEDRMRDALDEYYAFKNDYPESKHASEVEKIYRRISKKGGDVLKEKEIED